MEHIELIEAYFSNTLSVEERDSFQDRLETDQEFAAEFEDYQLITEGIKQMADEADLTEKMNQWDEQDRMPKALFTISPLRIAAVVAPLLLVSGLLYYYSSYKSSNDDLFTSYYSPYVDVISNRSNSEQSLGVAMNAYNTMEYENAIELFNYVLSGESDSDKVIFVQFYQAISYLSIDETEESERLLLQVVGSDNLFFQEVSEWYLLLVYVKTDQNIEAKKQIKLILNDSDHLFYEDTKKLNEEWIEQ